jgi:hypothetical protein
MKRSMLVPAVAVLALGGQFAAPARAADVQWSIGVNSFTPGVAVGTVITNAPVRPAPVYVAPPGVGYSPPPPVYVSPPPLYVPRPPAYVAPPPIYYPPPPPVYGPPMPPVYVPAAPRYIAPPVVYAAPVVVPVWPGYHRSHWRR